MDALTKDLARIYLGHEWAKEDMARHLSLFSDEWPGAEEVAICPDLQLLDRSPAGCREE